MANRRMATRKVEEREAIGRSRRDARFTAASSLTSLPSDYGDVLEEIKHRIRRERLRVVMAANSAMVLLYWDIGKMILERQERAGWGARVIDRLAKDLGAAFPETRGFSPRNLKYMRAFAAAWPDRSIVQRSVAQLPWRQNIALMERLSDEKTRLWYAEQAFRNGWSQPILCLQIERRTHDRRGKAITNFTATLPPNESDMVGQVFKDPYLWFLATSCGLFIDVVDSTAVWLAGSALALEASSRNPDKRKL